MHAFPHVSTLIDVSSLSHVSALTEVSALTNVSVPVFPLAGFLHARAALVQVCLAPTSRQNAHGPSPTGAFARTMPKIAGVRASASAIRTPHL